MVDEGYHKIGPNKKAKFEEDFNLINFLYGHLKEMLAVTTYLLCLSRVGNSEFMAAPFILYFVLITYAFPYLNPALFWSLRLGPYFNYIKVGKTDSQFKGMYTGAFRTIAACIAMFAFQLLGCYIAAESRNSFVSNYGTEVRTSILTMYGAEFHNAPTTGVQSLFLSTATQPAIPLSSYNFPPPPPNSFNNSFNSTTNKSATYNNTNAGCSGLAQWPYQYKGACSPENMNWVSMYFLEEWADTFFFCVAVMYFLEVAEAVDDTSNPAKITPGVQPPLINTNIDYSIVSEGVGMKSASSICFILLGLSYAFPTAHHGMHVTMYYKFLQVISGTPIFSDDEINGRIGGSIIGAVMAILLYWAPDVWDAFVTRINSPSSYKMLIGHEKTEGGSASRDAFKPQSWLYTKIERQRGGGRYHAVA